MIHLLPYVIGFIIGLLCAASILFGLLIWTARGEPDVNGDVERDGGMPPGIESTEPIDHSQLECLLSRKPWGREFGKVLRSANEATLREACRRIRERAGDAPVNRNLQP